MADHKFQIPALDGVRGTALLIVMLAHTTPQVFPGGNIGVDLFFILSGFLITSILLRERATTGTISIPKFYARRALRLLPALFLMVGAIIAWSWLFDPASFDASLTNAPAIILYWWNWWMALGWQPQQLIFAHLWSLSVEEQFYIVWPFVLLLTLPRLRLFFCLLVAGLVVPAIARFGLWESGPSLHLYFRSDLRFDSLMWGVLGAWLFFHKPDIVKPLAQVGMVAFGLFLVLSRFNLLSNGVLYLGGYSAMLALGTVITLAACGPSSPLVSVLTFKPLRWTGKISYGLYLWHVPAFHLCRGLPVEPLWQNLLGIVASYAIASASFYGMERYFLALKPRHNEPITRPLPDQITLYVK